MNKYLKLFLSSLIIFLSFSYVDAKIEYSEINFDINYVSTSAFPNHIRIEIFDPDTEIDHLELKINDKKYESIIKYNYIVEFELLENILSNITISSFNKDGDQIGETIINNFTCYDPKNDKNLKNIPIILYDAKYLLIPPRMINSITTLKNFHQIKWLNVSGNDIKTLSPLSEITTLEHIDLFNNLVSNYQFLSKNNNLKFLSISTEMSNPNILTNFPNLEELEFISVNDDLSFLLKLQQLKRLTISGWDIYDFEALSKLTNLESFHLIISKEEDKISDINFISSMINLKELWLNNQKINNIYPLINNSQLKFIYLSDNNISDITVLADIKNLEEIDISNNNISDLSPLQNLEFLRSLSIKNNPISDFSVIESMNLDYVFK